MHHSEDSRNASHQHNPSTPMETRRVFSGKVTKILDTFGFIDGDVFFQPSVVRGGQAKVGDSVYVECQYSEHLPFKWNASRVQIMPPQESSSSTGNKQPPAVSSSYVPQTAVGMTPSMSHGSSTGPITSREDPRQSSGNNYWQSGSTGSGSAATPAFAGASRNPLFVSEYTQQPQENTNTGPPGHHFSSNIQAQSGPPQAFSDKNNFQNAPIGNGNSVTFTTTPGSAFLTSPMQQQFDPFVSMGPGGGQFAGGPPRHSGPQHSGPPPSAPRENRPSRWEPREARSSGPIHRDSDDRRRHDRRDIRIDRDRKDGKDEFGRDRPPPEPRNARFNERLREKSLSPGSNTGSVSSRYDSKGDNLPKYRLLPNYLSAIDLRSRYGSKIHIPSDFETLLINSDFEMDLNSIPKPLRYKIHDVKKKKDSGKKTSDRDKDKDKDKDKEKDKDKDKEKDKDKDKEREKKVVEEEKKSSDQPSTDETVPEKLDDKSEALKEPEEEKTDEKDKMAESKPVDETSDTSCKVAGKDETQVKETTASTNSKVKSEVDDVNTVKYTGPKHGVKVILLSLPEMNSIIEKVFGYDFERQSSSGHYYPLNKLISFLAFRNQNDGYSLIGGKFNAQLDGLVGDEPNLIATAIRCVKEQTGIDLTRCSKWMSVASFLYNKDDALHDRPHTEYSTIFMPDIWSLLDDSLLPPPPPPTAPTVTSSSSEDVKVPKEEPTSPSVALENECTPSIDTSQDESKVESEQQVPASTPMDICSEHSLELEKLDELKVVELKSKLDELGVKYARTLKKAELLSLLREQLTEQIKVENESSFQIETSHESQVISSPSNCASVPETVKRKIEPDTESQITSTDEPPSKKPTTQTESVQVESIETTQVKESCEQINPQQDTSETNVNKDVMKEKIIDVTGDFSFTLLTLHQALVHHKHDHFELSICAELLRESLIRSFSFFIVSSLNENSCNLNTSVTESPSIDRRKIRAPNYCQLVFSYFDERHTGSLSSDDLLSLVIHSGYKISKKSWLALTNNCDKIQYKNFNLPINIIKPVDITSPLNNSSKMSSSSVSCENLSSSVIIKDGIVYNCENLIRQADSFAKAQIQLQELTQKLDEREKQLNNFETRQKKMTSAIEKQNDEICALKRERETLKSKLDEHKKAWNTLRESFEQQHTLLM